MTDQLYFNGINGATGDYDLPPMTPAQLAGIIAGEEIDQGLLNELKLRRQAHWAVKEGVDPNDLAQSGWGIIMAHNADPAIKEALSELLAHRRKQAGARYREFVLDKGYRPGETKNKFLARFGAGPGPVDPDVVPYYLLIAGDPETISYRFQNQLDVQFAVGRIHFDTPQEYAQYARSIVETETSGEGLPRQATFFGVRTPDDQATSLSADHMIKPLPSKLAAENWDLRTLVQGDATKSQLSRLLGGGETPTLLFTASHGMGFPNGDPRQLAHQGALLCQDWPGPGKSKGPISPDWYFSADDIGSNARLLGSMAFFFACYGAGTPKLDEFSQQAFKTRAEIAPYSFVANLPRRLLSHPKGGMLAVVGHVERAWGYSFLWDRAGEQLTVFESALKKLMAGAPIGLALEYFNERYAEIASDLTVMIEEKSFGGNVDDLALAGMWTANNDARAYVIIGDPAVRLPLAKNGPASAKRATIKPIEIKSAEARPPAPSASKKPPAKTVTLAAEPASQTPETTSDTSFGLTEQLGDLAGSVKQFTSQLASALGKAAQEMSTLEVRTYTTSDLDAVSKSGAEGNAQLRALTRVAFDGDMQVFVPEKSSGEIDHNVWELHRDMVQQAQANRAQFLQAMAELASNLLKSLRP